MLQYNIDRETRTINTELPPIQHLVTTLDFNAHTSHWRLPPHLDVLESLCAYERVHGAIPRVYCNTSQLWREKTTNYFSRNRDMLG